MSTNARPKTSWKALIGICALVLIVALFIDPGSKHTARETANKVRCCSNLHQIGLAIAAYASTHSGQYPDSIATLMQNEQLTAAVFVCPSSNDETADGDSQAAVVVNLAKPHHVSYVYAGGQLTTKTVKDEMLIAYELPENHQGDGMNMLFGDGHAEWESMAAAKSLIAKATAATQP